MSRNVTWILQLSLMVLQGVFASASVPPNVHIAIGIAIGAIQSVLAAVAHSYNPDGTLAVQPSDQPNPPAKFPETH